MSKSGSESVSVEDNDKRITAFSVPLHSKPPLQEQIGSLRQQAGMLEGSLQAVTVAKNQLATEIDGVRQIAAEANAQVSLWKTEASQWKERTAKAEKSLEENQPSSKQKNRRTKPVGHSG